MATYQNIDELIDSEAAKVYEQAERKKKRENGGSPMDMDKKPYIKAEPGEHIKADPDERPSSSNSNGRKYGGPVRIKTEGRTDSADRYISEREENNERRAHAARGGGGGSDRDSANGSTRSRRSRSPRRDSRRTDRSRERQPRDSYPGSRRGDDSYRPDDRGGRPRRSSRSPGYDRHNDYRGGGGYGRRGGRDARDDRDRHRDGGRGGGDRRRSPPPAQPTEDERDKRTVFVQQLAARLRTKQLKEFFEQAGPVADAQIVKDRVSQRSKGSVILCVHLMPYCDHMLTTSQRRLC